MADAPDTSRISFTALYTSQVWQRHGLGDPVLDHIGGAALHAAVMPLNFAGNLLRRGFDLETMLLQRHLLIDHLLEEAIVGDGVRQVVEVAAGLSPRGIRFRKRFADVGLRYVEADLPAMAADKRARLERGSYLCADHLVVECNALAKQGPGSLSRVFRDHLDLDAPAVIITEGLVNYFPPEQLRTMWRGFRAALQLCARGIYLSDIAFELGGDPLAPLVHASKRVLGWLTRGSTHLHFPDAAVCAAALRAAGFADAGVYDPVDFIDRLGLPVVDGAALVRVLRAEVQR